MLCTKCLLLEKQENSKINWLSVQIKDATVTFVTLVFFDETAEKGQ
jgi:hypothetical protein